MRKSLILASLLASASAVNAEIYIDGGVNWTLYTPTHIKTDLASGLFNPRVIRHTTKQRLTLSET